MRASDALGLRLTDYLEGALPPDERLEVERLLAGDAQVARELEAARLGRELLAELPKPPVPAGFVRRVKRRVRRRSSGAYFDPGADLLGFKLSIEVFTVIAIATMGALYFLGELGRQVGPGPLEEAPAITQPLSPE